MNELSWSMVFITSMSQRATLVAPPDTDQVYISHTIPLVVYRLPCRATSGFPLAF